MTERIKGKNSLRFNFFNSTLKKNAKSYPPSVGAGKRVFYCDNSARRTGNFGQAANNLKAEQYKFVKRIYDNYYDKNPDGKAFPMVKWSALPGMESILRKSKWHGEIDLNNTELLTKFKNYVAG